jgi:hypothetical protein
MFEVENVGEAPIALPVWEAAEPVPRIDLGIREEPEVKSPSRFGKLTSALYVVPAGGNYRVRVGGAYFIAYGKLDREGWIRFKPQERPYHVTATMECKGRHQESWHIYVPGRDCVLQYAVQGGGVGRDRRWVRYERCWHGTSLQFRSLVPVDEREVVVPGAAEGKPPHKLRAQRFVPAPRKEDVVVQISDSSVRIEDSDLNALDGKDIPIWTGRLVSNTVKMRLD